MKNTNLKIVKTDQNNKKIINGRWAKSQHDRFMKALEKFGRDWLKVQRFVKTRTLNQVRSHAQKVFLKMSDQDIESLIRGQGDSDHSQKNDRFETVKSRNVDIKSLNSKNSHNHANDVNTTNISQITTGESLLDILKRAIQHQTLELQSQNIRRNPTRQNKTTKSNTLFSFRQHQRKAPQHQTLPDHKNTQNLLQQPTQNINTLQKHQKNYEITQNILPNYENIAYLPMNFHNITQQLVNK